MPTKKLIIPIITSTLICALLLIILNAESRRIHSAQAEALLSPEAYKESNVDIVVQFEPGEDIVRGVRISDPVSGLDALLDAELDIIYHDSGADEISICAINGVGCLPPEPCLCDAERIWNYRQWIWMEESWQDPGVGPISTTVEIGDVEGWRWGPPDAAETLPPGDIMVSVSNALDWLKIKQNTVTGGYETMENSSEVLLAVGSNDHKAVDWRQQSYTTPLGEYITTFSPSYANTSAESSGKLGTGIAAADHCWSPTARSPSEYYSPTLGAYSINSGYNAWAILGSLSMGQSVPITAINTLKSQVQNDGGWEWSPGAETDTRTTALVIQALTTTGEPTTSALITNALAFLDGVQNNDGGFPLTPGSDGSDTESTSFVTQAIYTVGQVPTSATWVISDTNPIEYLQGMQLVNGSFQLTDGSGGSLVTTARAVPALLGKPMPYQMRVTGICPSYYLPLIKNDWVDK